MADPITFVDLIERNQQDIDRLAAERLSLEMRKKRSNDLLPIDDQNRLNQLQQLVLRKEDFSIIAVRLNELQQQKQQLEAQQSQHQKEYDQLTAEQNTLRASQQEKEAQEHTLEEQIKPLPKGTERTKLENDLRTLRNELKGIKNTVERGQLQLVMRQATLEQLGETIQANLQEQDKLSTTKPAIQDAVFIKTRQLLRAMGLPAVSDHDNGMFGSTLSESERTLAATYGMLALDNVTNPESERFPQAVSRAVGEYTANKELFDRVLDILASEGDRGKVNEVRTEQWAAVVRSLRADGVSADNRHLRLLASRALANYLGVDDGAPPSSIVIDLPDLEAQSEVEIKRDNLHAAQALYFGAMLEEMRLWEVVDKLVDLFQIGVLPLGRGRAGDTLYRRWRTNAERISEIERRNMYARVFGFPGGDVNQVNLNRDFQDLFLRFVSAVSAFVRQFKVDALIRSDLPIAVSQEQVRKAGRDLAANLSLHTYGMAYSLATEIQAEIKEFIELLSDTDIKSAYGAHDMWQVVDQVATLELGGARNSVRYRTMANAGAIIIRWLADRADKLTGIGLVDIIDLNDIRIPPPRHGTKPTTNPNDNDLVNACEQWLAVTGTPDMRIEEYAQPVEGPTITATPVRIPAAARDLLSSVGVQAGISGNGSNGRGFGRY